MFYDLWASNVGKILGEEIAWSIHCPSMLEKRLSFPFQEIFVLSHPGNKDCCYGKRTMELPLWTQTQPIRWQLCVFNRKIAIFKETIKTDREREEKACKARSLEFQSTRKTLRVINKMAEKNSFIVEEACQFAVTMTWPENNWGGSITVLCYEHALHQLRATRICRWMCPCVYCCTEYTIKNDLYTLTIIVRVYSGLLLAMLLKEALETWILQGHVYLSCHVRIKTPLIPPANTRPLEIQQYLAGRLFALITPL